MNKVWNSSAEAVKDIGPGASVAIAGFGIGHRFPTSLLVALRDSGVGDLTVVCNSLGASGQMRAQILAENHQIRRLVAAFSARPGIQTAGESQVAAGEIELELVPQGILVERLRAGAAGLAGFYSPVGVDTELAEGKEIRKFGDEEFAFEPAMTVDFALLRAYRADTRGNLQFRGGSQNFNPAFAKAARTTIVEVDEIVPAGELPPDAIQLPGIFVDRVVQAEVVPTVDQLRTSTKTRSVSPTDRHSYDGKEGLSREEMAHRVARLLPEPSYVNLGLGIPTLVSSFVRDRDVVLHAENGILGYGEIVPDDQADLDHYNAGGEFVSLNPGASFFDSVTSFEIARSGRLDAVVLGAYQVSAGGDIANWRTPGMAGGAIGGAMDLTIKRNRVIAVLNHTDRKGRPKLVEECTFPPTSKGCVDTIVTDLGLFLLRDGKFELTEVAEGFTVDEVLAMTGMEVTVAEPVTTMQAALR